MQTKVEKASDVFINKLEGRGGIDYIRQAFVEAGLFDEYTTEYIVERFQTVKTRELLGRIDLILDTEDGKVRVRGVQNIRKWKQDGVTEFEYVFIKKMTLEEIQFSAQKYYAGAKIYTSIGDKLMDVVTGQIMIFEL